MQNARIGDGINSLASATRAARERLEAAGLDVAYRESPGGHQIDGPTIDAAREWLERAIPRRPL